ncbi:helix-turn-helix domain-containing protein [Gilvimarinus sp. DA14]|uniref:helix-turn-helix domain-containing protein n=1 Tax=Gilvimarinus sp. DA14 TaxID=2956798 RepID=UPI0020B898E6|nr:helix-turn-helix domain-containing protein [Gilvimarinus sp. DA14]UTF58662.1 helix-turn-helix domain-containing protein [Gilvimarinus sp. DA14]
MDNRIFNLHDIFLIITIFEVLLLAAYRTVHRDKNSAPGNWLTMFLLVVAIDMVTNLIMWNPEFPLQGWGRDRLLALLFAFSHFARGPLFYFYVRSLLQEQKHLGRSDWLHAIPVLVALLAVVWLGVTTTDLQSRADTSLADKLASGLWYFSSVVSVAYACWCVLLLNRSVRQAKQRLSCLPSSEIAWLVVLSLCFLVSWGWSVLVICIADFIGGTVADTVGTSHNFIRFLLINGLIFYNLACTWTLHAKFTGDEGAAEANPVSAEVLAAIELGIKSQRLHLQPSINIEEFAERIQQPARVVSLAINRELGTRFFEFINQHRVEHAKRLLADPSCEHMTVLDILLASGFNNKSSFHRFFNRLVGMSPTAYRRQHLNAE